MTDSTITMLSCGTVLCSAARAALLEPKWFSPQAWRLSGAEEHTSTGRATVLIGKRESETWVLRHYRRGGFVARFVDDHYLWMGLEQTRAFREWRLLDQIREWGMPAPEPVAACVRRSGVLYQADIITKFLPATRTLSAYLLEDDVDDQHWRRIGEMLKRFHDRGVCHPDLTAHNILLDSTGKTYLVDFDSARIRAPGSWRQRGIARLQRSLRKVALETGAPFDAKAWRVLVAAYYA